MMAEGTFSSRIQVTRCIPRPFWSFLMYLRRSMCAALRRFGRPRFPSSVRLWPAVWSCRGRACGEGGG